MNNRREVMFERKKKRKHKQQKKEWSIHDIESTLDEEAYKEGIIPFGILEKAHMTAHPNRQGISNMYSSLLNQK